MNKPTRIGTTYGLSRDHDEKTRKAEQVYVDVSRDPTHPVEIDAWVGYGSLGRIRLTRTQASELSLLLMQAENEMARWLP